jgi:hypothetical protein
VTASRIFGRRGSQGWVILAGESPLVRDAEASALDSINNILSPEGALVILAPAGEVPFPAQHFVNDFKSRFGDTLKMIDPLEVDPTLLQTTCKKAQLVLALGGNSENWFTIFAEERMPADPDLIVSENSVFIAIGSLVSVLGEWTYDPESDQITDGIGWFPNALFLLGSSAPASKREVRQKIESQMKSYAISIAPDTIIGIGPHGKVEIWSETAPEILLGQGWV